MKPVVDVHTIDSMTLDFRTWLDFFAVSFVVPIANDYNVYINGWRFSPIYQMDQMSYISLIR